MMFAGVVLLVLAVITLVGYFWAAQVATSRMFDGLRSVPTGDTISITATRSTRAIVFSRTESLTCSAKTSDGRPVRVGDGWPYLSRNGYGAHAGIDITTGQTYLLSCSSASPARFAVTQLSVFNDEPLADVILVGPVIGLIGLGLVIAAAAVRARKGRSRSGARPDAGTEPGSPWPTTVGPPDRSITRSGPTVPSSRVGEHASRDRPDDR
jgi:hypothetical protein